MFHPSTARHSIDTRIDYHPLTATADLAVSAAVVRMHQQGCDYILVVTADRLSGILTATMVVDLIATGIDLAVTFLAEVMRPTVTLTYEPNQSIAVGLSLMQQHAIQHLPIVDDTGNLIGLLTQAALLQSLNLKETTEPQFSSPGYSAHQHVLAYPELIDQIPAVIYTAPVVEGTQFGYISAYAQDLLNIPPEEWSSRFYTTWTEYIHPDDRDRVAEEIAATVATGVPFVSEYRMVTRDGRIIWVHDQARLVQIEAEHPPVLEGTAFEITDRKQVEVTLKQQLEQEQLLTQSAQRVRQSLNLSDILETAVAEVRQFLQTDRVIIFQFDPNWTGQVVAESVGADWAAILSTQIRDQCFIDKYIEPYQAGFITTHANIYADDLTPCHIELLQQFQVVANLVVPILQKEKLWGLLIAHHCAAPRQWQSFEAELLKRLALHLGIAIQQSDLYFHVQQELLERQRVEAHLRASELRYREQAALLDITTDAIFVRDRFNQITFWNRGAERLYGWSAAEVASEIEAELLDCGATNQVEKIWKAVFQQGEWQGELQKGVKSGNVVTVARRMSLIKDEAGLPSSILIVDTDITEKKQLERQFLRAQRLESIGTLASGIAHDLNNILTPILTAAQLLPLKFPTADEQTQKLLKMLEANSKRGAMLIKQVLSFVRGVEGKHTPLQLRHLLSDIQQIIQETFPRTIALELKISPDLWIVSGDLTQLHQVFMNLCINARDAMPEGGKLEISARNLWLSQADVQNAPIAAEAEAGAYVAISIADTGIGIPSDLLDRIFEPFFTTKGHGEGTGLGLASVVGILKSHHGLINVTSALTQGTEFTVFLPANTSVALQSASPVQLPYGQGETILLVDDEATIRETTKVSLEIYRYQVITAQDGAAAISIYGQHADQIHLVLTDMMMPSIGGQTVIQTLHTLTPDLKIVAMSGLISNKELALSSGASAFLPKPFMTEELMNLLHRLLVAG